MMMKYVTTMKTVMKSKRNKQGHGPLSHITHKGPSSRLLRRRLMKRLQ